jgi:hypothetical protein
MVLWCVDAQSMNRKEVLAEMENVGSRLRPAKGSFVISSDEWPENLESDEGVVPDRDRVQGAGCHLLTVGYDRHRLLPLVEALIDGDKQEKD